MDWDTLKVFLALARTGTLSDTARQLGVDHSTVSRRIGALENALGMKLFDRLPRGYALTPEGQGLLPRAEEVENAVLSVERLAQGQDSAETGTVTVSAPPAFASHVLAPRLGGFHTKHPGILLEILAEPHTAHLHRREADIAVRLMPPEQDGLVARRIGQMGFGLYASPAYRNSLTPENGGRFLGYAAALDHVPQQRWLHRQAGGRPLALRTNDLNTLAAVTRAGMGVAALPHFIAAGDSALVPVPPPVADPAPTRGIWLVVHTDIRRAPRVRTVMNCLAAIVAQARPLLEGPKRSDSPDPRSGK